MAITSLKNNSSIDSLKSNSLSLKTQTFTPAEKAIIKLMAQGHSNSLIAALLYVEPSTIKTHIRNIYLKAQIDTEDRQSSRYLLLKKLVEEGVIPCPYCPCN